MPKYYVEILEPIIKDSIEIQIEFFRELGLLRNAMSCMHCDTSMTEVLCHKIKDKYVFKCQNKECVKFKTTKSIRHGSFLEHFNIILADVLKLLWKFSQEIQCVDVIHEIECGKNSLNKFYSSMRTLCKRYYEDNDILLGGHNCIINIDESLFRHKPKYHRGRATKKEIWVLGMVDTSRIPLIGVMIVVPNRSASTLLPIIKKHVKVGSLVHTDSWRSYNNINSLTMNHEVVNHNLNFVDPVSGVHTQFVESYWAKQKYRQKKMKGIEGSLMTEYLSTFMWWDNICRKNFQAVVDLIKCYYYLVFINNFHFLN